MMDYLSIPYAIFAIITIVACIFAQFPFKDVVFAILFISLGYYLLSYPKIYLGVGMVVSIVSLIRYSFNGSLKEKNSIVLDMYDIIIMMISSLLSTLFWSNHVVLAFLVFRSKKLEM